MPSVKEIQIISWKQAANLGGQPFGINPQPEMLSPAGLTIQRKFKKLGRGVQNDDAGTWYQVVYNEDYVVHWMARKLIALFPGMPYNMLQKLLSKAMAEHKETLKDGY